MKQKQKLCCLTLLLASTLFCAEEPSNQAEEEHFENQMQSQQQDFEQQMLEQENQNQNPEYVEGNPVVDPYADGAHVHGAEAEGFHGGEGFHGRGNRGRLRR
jgi:hypothetical protein